METKNTSTTNDIHAFRDGQTAPAHRHTNPDGSHGGWVADTALVDADVYVGIAAEALPGHIYTAAP